MWNWLKNVASAPSRPGSLSQTQFAHLRADLKRLDSVRSGIANRLLEYIGSGENEAALSEVAALPGASTAMVLNVTSGWHADRPKDRHAFFQDLKTDDTILLLRIAAVYDAISRSESRDMRMVGLPPDGQWLEVFLREITQFTRNTYPARAQIQTAIRAETIEAMIKACGQNTDLLVRAALWVDPSSWGFKFNQELLLTIPGFADSLVRHPETARESFTQKDYRCRVYVIETLGKVKVSLAAVLDDIVAAAISPAKQVREAAITLLYSQVPACLPALRQHATSGTNDERLWAIRALWKLDPEQARPFLEERAKADKSKKILDTIREMLVPAGTSEEAPMATKLEMPPPVPEVNPFAPLPADFGPVLETCFREAAKASDAGWERIKSQPWAKTRHVFQAPSVGKVVTYLERGTGLDPQTALVSIHYAGVETRKRLDQVIAHPGCTLLHALRWCMLMNGKPSGRNDFWVFNRYQSSLSPLAKLNKINFDLRELAATCRTAGINEELIGRACLQQGRVVRNPIFRIPDEKLWPYFAPRLEILEQALGLKPAIRTEEAWWGDYWQRERRQKALEILGAFPQVPAIFQPLLWELALGPTKQDRIGAQDALAKLPGKEAKIIAALGNGQQQVRANAAAWLGRLKFKPAIPALEAALKKERSEVVKGALFDALEALGAPLESYLDCEKLAEEAKKEVAKGVPKELAWFPVAQLPAMQWNDSGKTIPADVLIWFLIQATKLKECVPTPLVKRYASFFKASQGEALGRFIVQAWITQDTLPAYNHEEAAAKADAGAKQMAVYVAGLRAQKAKYASAYDDWSEQKHYRALLNGYLSACKGSAQDSKGVLAVAAACAGSDVVPPIQRFLKQWYGLRHHQGKALIQMLSCLDHPSAIQLLLSVGNRFRTKGIQDEAARLCQELADRKGWTLDELADRTVPAAGFDESGELELSYGNRSFVARLGEEFEISLFNQEGREISSLPEPNKADDETLAKEAKTRLAAARKELKGILKSQQERLYEAMCTQRTWVFQDWDTYLNRHVIIGAFVQRLVWGVVEGGVITRLFRPLADRSLTNELDEPVVLAPDTVIRLAHDALLSSEQRVAWTRHLADYEITPLFAQFGRPKFELSAARSEESEIKDFEGHLLESFKLRGRLTKQGYTRGQALDGGWWISYHKRFTGLGLEAVIEFTGSPMPEENRTVAIISLSFQRLGDEAGMSGENILLGELPLVLLTECWNDLRLAAAEGTGFDPEWQKKTQY